MAAPAGEPPGAFDPFSPAEAAAQDVIDAVLSKGGKMLHDAYLERRAYPFAVETTSQQLVAELMMCYVRCDPGEDRPQRPPEGEPAEGAAEPALEQDNWAMEPEPARCRIDTWARSVVPIRKKITLKKEADEPKTGRRRPSNAGFNRPSATPMSSRPPSRQRSGPGAGNAGSPTGDASAERRESSGPRQPIPLSDDRQEDEEEMRIREMKERETKRKADEEVRVKKKVAEENQEAAKIAQVQDQMKSKPFTYDNSGNIIWVQPVEVNKLPNHNPPLNYSVKVEKLADDSSSPKQSPRGKPATSAKTGAAGKSQKGAKVYSDAFKKNVTLQPSVFDNMVMSPGVELSNRSGKRQGQPRGRDPDAPMSRKEYEDMAKVSGAGQTGYPDAGSTQRVPSKPTSSTHTQGAAAGPVAAVAQDVLGAAAPGPSPEAAPQRPSLAEQQKQQAAPQQMPRKSVRMQGLADGSLEMIARPPETPRPQQPAPPPSARRVKNGAMGHLGTSARERVATSKGSRFPNCAPPPPLGATMGHGLVKGSQEDFYYPPGEKKPLGFSASASEEQVEDSGALSARARGMAPIATPRSPGGSIVSKKPDFLQRYFPTQ